MFYLKFLILIMCVPICTVESGLSEIDKKNDNINTNLSSAINFVLKSVNATNVRIVGCSSFFQNNFYQVFEHLRLNVSLEMLNVERNYVLQKKIPKTDFFMIFMDQHIVSFLQLFGYRIRKHKVLIALNNKVCDNERLLVQLASVLWANKLLNFIILRDCIVTSDVHTYFPFANDQCKNFSETNIMRMGTFYFNTSGTTLFESELKMNTNEYDTYPPHNLPFFPNKVPLKINNCTITVSASIWPPNVINSSSTESGIEMDFITTLGLHLNASVSIVLSANSNIGLKHGEFEEHTGRLASIKNETFDLMIGAIPSHINILRDFDTTECYLPNSLTFIVPRAGIFPSSMILWATLEKHTRLFLLIVVVVLFMSIVMNLMLQMPKETIVNSKHWNNFIYHVFATLFILLRSLIETSTPIFPRNRTIKYLYAIWFAACMILSCYFNTTLTSFFTKPGQLRQLKSVQDIIDSKIKISLDGMYSSFLSVDPSQIEYFASQNVETSVLLGLKLAAMGEAATFTDKSRAEHIAVQWVSSNGKRSIHFISDGSMKFWNNIILYRGNVLTDRINNLVKRINQSGYWEFQKRRYYNLRLIRIMIRQYLMVYNYHEGINNDVLINQLNKDFHDSNMGDMENGTEKLMVETNEEELIRRFVKTDRTLIAWDHLSSVFLYCAVGMAVAGIVFICECLLSLLCYPIHPSLVPIFVVHF